MRLNRTGFIVVGVILLGGLAAGCAQKQQQKQGQKRQPLGVLDDEERPPIVINEDSIHFFTDRGWTDRTGNKRIWRPAQPNGKHVKHYDVVVTSNGGDAGCQRMTGKTVSIVYGGYTFKLLTKRHSGNKKDEPELDSPQALTQSGDDLSYAGTGDIELVKVDNRQCNVKNKAAIKITATPKSQ